MRNNHLQDDLSLVLTDVGNDMFLSLSSSVGSAQSCSLQIRLGIREISENCIMHNFSQLEPKKSIYKVNTASIIRHSIAVP